MSEAFTGEIKMFAGNFAPRSYALCDGQLQSISQNNALFSLLGTIYGGDGRTTFGLPDLRGRIPIQQGSGPGLTPRSIGNKAGQEAVTLNTTQLPSHNHEFACLDGPATSPSPANTVPATGATPSYANNAPTVTMGTPVGNTGGSQSHTNLMPALCINFIISLYGIYPSRS